MTLRHWQKQKIKCPDCGTESPSKRWLQVWTSRKESKKKALKCPKCKKLLKLNFWESQECEDNLRVK